MALVYGQRFWDLGFSNMGLPGDGPAFQVYDSSTKGQELTSLTFFALVPSSSPAYSDDRELAHMVAQQMGTVWKALHKVDMAEQVIHILASMFKDGLSIHT